jgi:uncharacterized protein (DUF2249 family)
MNKVKDIDVRTIPSAQRHSTIFKTFNELNIGESFELINDHDPKPLYYQFQFEYPGKFLWQYIEQGPNVWRVNIEKIK